jgi:hypothetical protein
MKIEGLSGIDGDDVSSGDDYMGMVMMLMGF